MLINEEGKQLLIHDLLETLNSTGLPRYDQTDFGYKSCGAAACMAGLCLWRKIGREMWHMTAFSLETMATYLYVPNEDILRERTFFMEDALEAGVEQLGIKRSLDNTPMIFNGINSWPMDLYLRYLKAEEEGDPEKMVTTAIDALNRCNEFGEISDENGRFDWEECL